MLKLRYFTPREVANLHGFPADFRECYYYYYYLLMHVSFHAKQLSFAASTRNKSLISMHLTNEFLVSVRLFSNRSQITSKYGKNSK